MRDITVRRSLSAILLALVVIFSSCIVAPDAAFGPDATNYPPPFETAVSAMSASASSVLQEERDALLAIYDSLNGDGWLDNGTKWGTDQGWRNAPDSVPVLAASRPPSIESKRKPMS